MTIDHHGQPDDQLGCRDGRVAFDARDHLSDDDLRVMSLPALLAIALKPVDIKVCRTLVDTHGGQLRRVINAGNGDLCALGFTPKVIERFRAIGEIAKRHGQEEWPQGVAYRASCDVYAHCRERMASETVEHFYAVLLDNKHSKLREVLVSKGSLTSSVVHPRDAFLPAIRESAAAIIFYHNHPSGDPTPSAEDIQLTRRLRDVGDLVGIRVLDHIVVGKGRYVSFVDDGYW